MTVSPINPNKMAVTMAIFWVSLVLSIIGSNAAGEFSILHSPKSLRFLGADTTQESLIKEIFSAALGLSVEENSEWKGLYVVDPFNTPEAIVEVHIDGVSSLGGNSMGVATFPLKTDEYEPDTYVTVEHRIKQHFTNGGNKLVNAKLSDIDDLSSTSFVNIFGDLKTQIGPQSLTYLKDIDEDNQFLSELQVLKAITEKVKSGVIKPDNVIDYYYFRFRSLHALSDFHGPNSMQTKEAKKLLADSLQKLSAAFAEAYDGSVVVSAVTTDVAHTRRVRSAQDEPAQEEPAQGEPVPDQPAADKAAPQQAAVDQAAPAQEKVAESNDGYSADYPAIFNIILWFGVVFVFTLVAIIYALMDMDPGRDSIIYRMTSTRMKKDN